LGKLKDFMDLYSSKSTLKTYRWGLREFYKTVYGETVDTKKGMSLEDAVEKYFSEERDYEADVKRFFSNINDRPPKSIRTLLACVKSFLLDNNVELGEAFWRRISRRIKGSRAISKEKVPSNVELRRILIHMPVHGKALYLTLASSGMRIGEAMKLKLEDINLESDPVKINIGREYTKSGDARITFVSGEAKESIEEWLKTRENYIKTAVARSHFHEKDAEDERIFPFNAKTATDIWNNALDKANLNGKDKETNRHKIHPHVLRKFFRSNAGMVSVDMAEALMGHSAYLTDVYRKYPNPEETLGAFYKKVEPSLEIFGSSGEQVVQLTKATDGLRAEYKRLSDENDSLKKRLDKAEQRRQKMERDMEKWRQEADIDIAKIIDVYLNELNAPLGYSGEQDEDWFDRMREKDIKTLEDIRKRRSSTKK
jgi:integrase